MTVFPFFITLLWLLSAIGDYSEFSYIWQLKEYRLDRFRDFLSTKEGKWYWWRYSLIGRWFILVVIILWPNQWSALIIYPYTAVLALDLVVNFWYWKKGRLRRPVLTKKALVLIAGAMILEGAILIWADDIFIGFVLLALRFCTMSALVILLSIPTKLLKIHYITKATKKIAQYPNLCVIGITGSYGKTTVKEFLSHTLSAKKNVIHTPKNTNTEIGVATFILSQSFENVDIFVVEMGAYRIGEIEKICNIVQPKIGILTAINEQHLSLFGGIKKTQQAKYELLRAIPHDGLCIANSDNDVIREKLDTLRAPVETFGFDAEHKPSCHIMNVDVRKGTPGIDITYQVKEDQWRVDAPVYGGHNAMNIAPCILVSRFLDLSKETIISQIETISLPEQTLTVYKYGKATIIDDSYNANPVGFKSALDVLSSFASASKRIVITRGMFELGKESEKLHEQVGEEIAYVADELVITHPDAADALRKGAHDTLQTHVHVIIDRNNLLAYVQDIKNTDAVVLLENKLPSNVYQEITTDRHEKN